MGKKEVREAPAPEGEEPPTPEPEEKPTEETVGAALIKQNETVIKLLELLVKQNESKLEKLESALSLLGGVAQLQGGDKTNPYENLEKMFPDHLREMLNLSTEGKEWVAKPRRFLGKENFRLIADVSKQLGGRYVSAGKDSHFRGPLNG